MRFVNLRELRSQLTRYKLIFVDTKIPQLRKVVSTNAIRVKASEQVKSFDGLKKIIDDLLRANVERLDKIAVIGGGTLIDVCGFACAVYKRGIAFDVYPTTLLAMVDAAIGGKNGINYKGKNLVGTFYEPDRIYVCLGFLDTLSNTEFLSGLAEIIKIAFLADEKLVRILETKRDDVIKRDEKTLKSIIRRSIELKMRFVEEDPYDYGIRNYLNYGHTIGHAVEAASGFKIEHGLAVAKGIALETYYARMEGMISERQYTRTLKLLKLYGYNTEVPASITKYLVYDKKNRFGQSRIMVPRLETI